MNKSKKDNECLEQTKRMWQRYKTNLEFRVEQLFMIVGGSVGFSDSDGVSLGIVGGFDDECGFYDLPGSVLELNNSDGSWAIINDDSDSDGYDIGLYNGKNLDHHTLRHADTHTIFKEIWTKSKNSMFCSLYRNRFLF